MVKPVRRERTHRDVETEMEMMGTGAGALAAGDSSSDSDSDHNNAPSMQNKYLALASKAFDSFVAKSQELLHAVSGMVTAYLKALKDKAPQAAVVGLGLGAGVLGLAVLVAKGPEVMATMAGLLATMKSHLAAGVSLVTATPVFATVSHMASCMAHCLKEAAQFLVNMTMLQGHVVAQQVTSLAGKLGGVSLELNAHAKLAIGSLMTALEVMVPFVLGKPALDKAVELTKEAATKVGTGMTTMYTRASAVVVDTLHAVKDMVTHDNTVRPGAGA